MKLEVQHISMNYGKKLALDSVSFKLLPGFYGMLGPNGAGKSTLIKILTGGLMPTDGEIFFDGDPVAQDLKKYLCKIGYMPQEQALYPDFTVFEYLDYMAALKGMPKAGRAERIAAVLKEVELFDDRFGKLKTFSGGMRQRALLAQALLDEPPILILDEPMSGLDPGQRVRIRKLLRQCGEQSIVLMATHIVADVETAADSVLLLSHGRLVGFDTVEALCNNLWTQEARAYTLEEIYVKLCGDEVVISDSDTV